MISRRRCRPATTAAASCHPIQRRSKHLSDLSQRLDDGPFSDLGVGGNFFTIQVRVIGLGEVMSLGVGQMIVKDVVGRIVVRGVLLKESRRQIDECLLGSLIGIGTVCDVVGLKLLTLRGRLIGRCRLLLARLRVRLLVRFRIRLTMARRWPIGIAALHGSACIPERPRHSMLVLLPSCGKNQWRINAY